MGCCDFGRHFTGIASGGSEGGALRYPRNAADLLQGIASSRSDGDGPPSDWESAWIDLGGEG